jgi:hypothetical protein
MAWLLKATNVVLPYEVALLLQHMGYIDVPVAPMLGPYLASMRSSGQGISSAEYQDVLDELP